MIPVVNTGSLFGSISAGVEQSLSTADAIQRTNSRSRNGESMLMIVESLQGLAALPVDDVLGQAQVVVKSMQAGSEIPEVSGAAILGDGRTVLILDPQRIVEHSQTPSGELAA